MKKIFMITLGIALAAAAGLAFGHDFLSPASGGVMLAMGMAAMPNDIASAFAQVFEAKKQFPRWFQPDPNIGQILVHSQAEEDELRARDWSPKPLPGSEAPVQKLAGVADVADALEVLQAERALFEKQKAEFMAAMESRMSALEGASGPVAAPSPAEVAPASASLTPPATEVAGALSDASVEVAPKASKK